MNKSMHLLYFFLLVLSVITVLLSFCIPIASWNAVIMSIGCGGIASVIVAWLIDLQNCRNRKAENQIKYEIILRQYVKLYRRLMQTAAYECYGLYSEDRMRSLQEWLDILSDESRYNSVSHKTMQWRCKRLSGSLIALQRYIENFQIQSATLILNDFPEIESVLAFFELQHIHAWGSLKQFEGGYYKVFCETIYVLYKEFVERFPQYQDELPKKYSNADLKKWKT